MPIYWSIFALSIFALILAAFKLRPENLSPKIHKSPRYIGGEYWVSAIVLVPLLFFLSFRDEVLDTYAYVAMYKNLPTSWDSCSVIAHKSASAAFIKLAWIVKTYLSDSHYTWFFLLATVNILCIVKTCSKYSPNLLLSIYLFIAGTTFTWCLNGTRQFLVVTILFFLSKYVIKKNTFRNKLYYIAAVIIGSYIHISAIFLIPIVLFASSHKIYGKGMLIIVLVTIVGTMFSSEILDTASEIVDKDYSEAFAVGTGSSVMRLLFTCVPTIISLCYLKRIKQIAPPAIIWGINMSLVGACFMFAATFTNGILIGRMPMYFTIYNLFVLPWLLYNCFGRYRTIMLNVFLAVYACWFYFQMCVAWHNLPYVSYFLNLHYD